MLGFMAFSLVLKMPNNAHEIQSPWSNWIERLTIKGRRSASLFLAHLACSLVEYIPWLRDWMETPAKIMDGFYVAPEVPGASMTPSKKALAEINNV